MNVLIVDDEVDIRENISSILKKKGFEPVTAGNLKDAEQLIRTQKWDLIISDIMIPHLGGFELIDLVKEITPDTPVLIVTGMEREVLQATFSSADAVLSKPFTSAQLMKKIAALTGDKVA
jgi:DNA-binding response OmpR family regulator